MRINKNNLERKDYGTEFLTILAVECLRNDGRHATGYGFFPPAIPHITHCCY
jgi:hypothetical protein